MKIELDNFILEKCDILKNEHKSVIISLDNDDKVKEYVGDLLLLMEMLNEEKRYYEAYIAYYNDKPIGFIMLAERDDEPKKEYEITYSILPKYRNEYLGSLLVQEFSEKMFEINKNIDKITAFININNIASKKAVSLAGYEQENNIKFTQRRL